MVGEVQTDPTPTTSLLSACSSQSTVPALVDGFPKKRFVEKVIRK